MYSRAVNFPESRNKFPVTTLVYSDGLCSALFSLFVSFYTSGVKMDLLKLNGSFY